MHDFVSVILPGILLYLFLVACVGAFIGFLALVDKFIVTPLARAWDKFMAD